MNEATASTAQADSWESRVQNIANALGTTSDHVLKVLTDLGYEPATGLEMLDDDDVTKFGDFRDAFNPPMPSSTEGKTIDTVPLIKLRLAFKFAKGSKKSEDRPGVDPRTLQLRELGFKVRLEDANLSVLLSMYLPDQPSDAVTLALKKRFGDKPVIAFNQDSKVAVTETIGYAADLEQGLPAQDAIMVDGELVTLVPVGVLPDIVLEEDPLYEHVPLRGGRSTKNHRNWTSISREARQFIRVIVERNEINVGDREAVIRLMERAADMKQLKEAYPEAALEFRTRKTADTLPSLKITRTSAKPNAPFGHRKY